MTLSAGVFQLVDKKAFNTKKAVGSLIQYPREMQQHTEKVDKLKAVFQCSVVVMFLATRQTHLKRHHTNVNITAARQKMSIVKMLLPSAFKQPFSGNSTQAKAIANVISVFIAVDLSAFSFLVLENTSFKHTEPQYEIPSHPHFSQKVIPALYGQAKASVVQSICFSTHG